MVKMGSFSGYSCVKFVFFTFNAVFWLLGCAILGVGIWLHIAKGNYASVAPSFSFLSVTALCIAAGVVVLVVGFFGCCGAIMENQCMLLTYFLLVVLIFLLEIIAGILAFVYKDEMQRVVQGELMVGLTNKYNMPDEAGLTATWDGLQKQFECCGVNNYTDWYKAQGLPSGNVGTVPESCCETAISICKLDNHNYWYHKGCYSELRYYFKKNLYIIGVIAIAVGVLQVLGLVASMALFCCLRNDKYAYD